MSKPSRLSQGPHPSRYQPGYEKARERAEKNQRRQFTEQDIARHLATMKPERLH